MSLLLFKSPHILLSFWLILLLTPADQLHAQVLKTTGGNGNWTQISWDPAGLPGPADDVQLQHSVTIQEGTIAEVNNLNITRTGKLTVNGTLIVNGDLSMENNGSEFIMGPNAIVIVYGNFNAANKVDVSVSSYLIIHGNFTKSGAENQGSLNINNGSIYIFGEVDGWKNFGGCDENTSYDGITPKEDGTCDYGGSDDFENNYDDLPSEIKELRSCFNLSALTDQSVCATATAVFSIDPVDNVFYEWQIKTSEAGEWTATGTDAPSLSIPNTTVSMSGNQFRVVLKPTENNTGNCRIAISNPAILTVVPSDFILEDISGSTQVCSGSVDLTYSVPEVENAVSYNWSFPQGWEVLSGGNSNSATVTATENALSGAIKLSVTYDCNLTRESQLQVTVIIRGTWTGQLSTNWNDTGNWSCSLLPSLETNVLIPAGLSNYPVLDSGASGQVKNLLIENGASLQVKDNLLEIAGNFSNSGNLDVQSGSIAFTGSSMQTIPAGAFENSRIENLCINNSAGVTSEAFIEITGILKVENGSFETGDRLRLISDAVKTALIDGSGNGQLNGLVTMQRYLEPAFGYKYFSSPFKNSVVGDFAAYVDLNSDFPHFFRYDENRRETGSNTDATGWAAYTDPSGTLNPAEGYALNFRNDEQPVLVELTGEVNNGNISINLQNHNRAWTKGFNLAGNPYPSPIDWDATEGWTKSNIDNAIYFFTAGSTDRYTGTYTSYVNGIQSDDKKSANIIPSMQGFFVHVSDSPQDIYPVNAELKMDNRVRAVDFDQEFLKSSEKPAVPLIRLAAGFDGKAGEDAAVVYFAEYASGGFDRDLDALKLTNTAAEIPSFYSLSAGKKRLSINAIPTTFTQDHHKIDLGIKAEKPGRMYLRLKDLENLPSGFLVYLIDSQKKIIQNLSDKPVYHFEISNGVNESRFKLLFTESILTNSAIAFDELFSTETTPGGVLVKPNLKNGQKAVVSLSNINGQLLESRIVSGSEIIKFSGIKSDGVYIINLSTGDTSSVKKVVINR